jgi:hypothetical protein
MSRCLTSDALSFPLNLQYNSLPIEKAARVPYPPQLMYLILSIFTLLFYRKDILSAFYAFLHPIHAVPESILVLTYTLFVVLSYTIIFLSLFTI